jgi:alpha-L-rhamnosidase
VFLAIGFVFVQTGLSQEFSYSGKVVNFAGEPIAGATVKLAKAGKSTKTADDGTFTLTSKSTSINDVLSRSGQPNFAALRDGYLEIRLLENAPVSITMFSVGGKTLFNKKTLLNSGVHDVFIPATSQGVYFIRVRGGGQEVTFKTYSLEADVLGGMKVIRDRSARASARQSTNSVFDDSLHVTKAEYLDYMTKMYKKTNVSDMVIRMADADHPIYTREMLYEIGKADFPSCHAPSIVELPDGTLLSTFFGGSREGADDVEARLSRKEPGKDWELPISAAHTGGGSKDGLAVENPSLFQNRLGKLFLFYMVKFGKPTRVGTMKTSTDGGRTWSEARKICDKCMGSEKNKAVQLEDGTILSPTADRNGFFKSGEILVEISTDEGETWTPSALAAAGEVERAIQPAILVHPDGRLQMVARGREGKIPTTWSNDKGRTWSPLEKTTLPANWAGIDAVTLRDGRHFIVYNHVPSNGKGPRNFLNLSSSKDGKAWSAALVLGMCGGGQLSYPSIIQGRDGLVHIVHTWHRKTIAHIVVNPYLITDETVVPMPDGKWPTSGPLSKGENKDKEG